MPTNYTESRYKEALSNLGSRVTEAQRRMLGEHANSQNLEATVLQLAHAAGQQSPTFTYSQYGRLGHDLAKALGRRTKESVWTRLVGSDSRDAKHNLVWKMHANLAKAVRSLGWGGDSGAPTVMQELANASSELNQVNPTTREELIQARLGQGRFRSQLVRYWGSCVVTGCQILEALVASHIKPWRACSNSERLDTYNGLLLLGTLDKLFDAGLITFKDNGGMMISKIVPSKERSFLGIGQRSSLTRVAPEHLPYLKWHRDQVFVRTRT